jgi:hypothetical protein
MDQARPKGCRVTPQPVTFNRPACQGKGRPAPRQARLCLLLPMLLAACETPGQINPRLLGRDISGAAAEARLPPPGLDQPFPNLASVPPIPDRPDPAARLALTTQLQAQRDQLNTPLADRRRDTPLTEGPASGQPPIPARPPAPAVLSRAPVIPWTTSGTPVVPARAAPSAAAPGATPPEAEPPQPEAPTPGAVPDLPSADLLAPTAPPPRPR